jgi:hypothetical protein
VLPNRALLFEAQSCSSIGGSNRHGNEDVYWLVNDEWAGCEKTHALISFTIVRNLKCLRMSVRLFAQSSKREAIVLHKMTDRSRRPERWSRTNRGGYARAGMQSQFRRRASRRVSRVLNYLHFVHNHAKSDTQKTTATQWMLDSRIRAVRLTVNVSMTGS